MLAPLPARLSTGVQNGFSQHTYQGFVQCCRALEAGEITAAEARTHIHKSIHLRPDLLELFVQWSTPVPAGGVCFYFVSTADLCRDLRCMDTALSFMLPALEPIHAQWGPITSPAIFQSDFAAFQLEYRACHAKNDADGKRRLTQEFAKSHLEKQKYHGHAIHLSHVVAMRTPTQRGACVTSVCGPGGGGRLLTIKQGDLDQPLAALMEKVHVFGQHFLQIHLQESIWAQAMWEMHSENVHQPGPHAGGVNVVGGDTTQVGTPQYIITCQACEENLRQSMAWLADCTPTMQLQLRAGSTQEEHCSVAHVRHAWKRELHRRSTLQSPHPADLV